MPYELEIALRYLRSKRRTGFISIITYASTGGVFLGTAALIIALSMANGFENEVLSRIVGTFAHFKIQRYHQNPVANYDSLTATVAAEPGVLAASPFIVSKAGISSSKVQDGILVMGIDLPREKDVTDIFENLKSGQFRLDTLESSKGNRYPGIVLGHSLADRLRMDVGEEVTLMSLKAGKGWSPGMVPRMGRFVLSGTTECGMYEYDSNISYIALKEAQLLFELPNRATGVHAKVANMMTADDVGYAIQDRLGYPYFSLDWKAQNRSLYSWMQIEKLVIFIVISLIILVAAFNIVSSLTMGVMEKTREIGILVSMGARRKSIQRIFVFQGIIVGALGSILGGVFGLFLCYLQHRYQFIPLPGDVYFIDSLPVQTRFLDTVAVLVSANLLCFLATLYPSSRAARLLPVEALRVG